MNALSSWDSLPVCSLIRGFQASQVTLAQWEPVRAGQESFISRAIFFNSQLWLLTDAGLLSSITEGSDQQVDIPLPEPAFDLWIQDGEPAVLTAERGGPSWALRKWSHGEWRAITTIPANGDQFVGVGSTGGTVTVLTSRRMIDVAGGDQRSVALKWPKKPLAGITSVTVTRDSLLVGFNIGEWGGGLRRIDRTSGHISIVESKPKETICGGLLNTDCDPVNGIAVEPWKEGCAAIAIGLVHFMARGSIVEVCGNSVTRLYSNSYGDDHYSTVPFFGLVAASADLWAVGIDGIYRIGPDGTTKAGALPVFQRIGNVSVSFAIPDLVLVLTDANRRRSVSGSVPMLVLR
jgi:hypothetical protein